MASGCWWHRRVFLLSSQLETGKLGEARGSGRGHRANSVLSEDSKKHVYDKLELNALADCLGQNVIGYRHRTLNLNLIVPVGGMFKTLL